MNKIGLVFFLMAIWCQAFAQLKVFEDGSIQTGSLNVVGSPEFNQLQTRILGNRAVFSNEAMYTYDYPRASAPMIRGNQQLERPIEPGYTWFKDEETGMFHPERGQIGWSVNGQEKMLLLESGNLIVNSVGSGSGHALSAGGKVINSSAFGGFSYYDELHVGGYGITSYINNSTTLAFLVHNQDNRIPFAVLGDGLIITNASTMQKVEPRENGKVLFNDAISKILQLEIYSSREGEGSGGFTLDANQLKELLPDAVFEFSQEETTYVDYNAVFLLLLEAFKEQNKIIEGLQNEISDSVLGSLSNREIKGLKKLLVEELLSEKEE